MLSNFLIVGIGGAIGSMMRHGAGLLFLKAGWTNFPWSTLTINLLGSFCIGLIVGWLADVQNWSEEIRLFAVVGILGGFTTFSAFSLESFLLFERGQYLYAAFYVAASVILSIATTFLGLFLIRTFAA
ncbi:MAG TPA: fluoride efflux transporter CrcB [Rhodospirillaceae bacterium]|nr:fluoride efflux transporter CrcB [Rhodospirillaceae bacterium]